MNINQQKKLRDITCCLLDMDGTIYLSTSIIPGAAEFLSFLDSANIKRIFLTNNSSKNANEYVKKLAHMGINVISSQIFTSGEATRITIKKRKQNAKIYLLGTESLAQEFREDGFRLISGIDKNECPDFVVLGFDTGLSYDKIHVACDFIRNKIPFIATHPDINCPLEGGACMPDTGAMIKMFEASTNISPEIIGKPHIHIIEALLDKYSLNPKELLMVGDRIYTDIQMAINANISSVLVLSGETSQQDLEKSDITPDFVCESVQELHDLYKTLKRA